MKLSEIILGLIKIPLDFLFGILAFLAAYELRSTSLPGLQLPPDLTTFPSIGDYLIFSTISVIILIALFAFNNAYSLKRQRKLSGEFTQIFFISGTWFMLIIAYFFLIRQFPFSRLVLGYAWILSIIFIFFGRIIIRFLQSILLKYGYGKRKIIFIGNNEVTQKIAAHLKKDPKYIIAGIIESFDELDPIIKKTGAREIIQTKEDLSSSQASDILDYSREHHLEYSFVPDLVSIHQINIDIETHNGIPVIKLKPTALDGWGRVVKRGLDVLGSLFGIIILSPIMLLTAIAIKIDSKGTIFFKYLDDGSKVKRVGQYGRLFNFHKFRTMFPNTHNLRYTELAENNTRKGSPLVKIKNDPRITRVGRILRKTNIDELPQLFNVLKGEMSLVGPRPHLPEEVAKYRTHHKFVLTIKPGITGLAQTSGRSDLDFEQEVQLDTYYIEHWSVWMDLKIILKTFSVFFKGYNE